MHCLNFILCEISVYLSPRVLQYNIDSTQRTFQTFESNNDGSAGERGLLTTAPKDLGGCRKQRESFFGNHHYRNPPRLLEP